MEAKNQLRDSQALTHVRDLYISYESGVYNDHHRYKYYGYNVSPGQYQYINGVHRTKTLTTSKLNI